MDGETREGADATKASADRAGEAQVQCGIAPAEAGVGSSVPEIQSLKHTEPPKNENISEEVEAGSASSSNTVTGGGDDGTVLAGDGEVPKKKGRGKDLRQRRLRGTGGLQLEKTGMWTVRCIINGKRVSKSTGTKDHDEAVRFLKKFLAPYVPGDAERTYHNIQAAVATAKQLEEMEEDRRPQMTLDKVWEAYDRSLMRRDLTKTTLDSKHQVWNHFKDFLNDTYPEVMELRRVERKHAESYLNLLRNGHSALTYNGRLCVLREIHRVVMEEARAKTNPWDGFKTRPDDSHTRRELTIEELSRVINLASREGFEWRLLFAIGMYTGLRLSDCCTLTWSEVDVVKSIIQRIPEKTKKYRKGKPVTIPIHRTLADLLVQTPIEERTGYVIPQLGALLSTSLSIEDRKRGMSKIQHRLGKIFHNAGIVTSVKIEGRKFKAPDAGFHSLRHTFVSLSANAGVPLHIVQEIVGHESNAMTRHYFHENIVALQQAVEAIPSISETGDVREGEVAQPDASRMFNRAPAQVEQLPQPPPLTLPAPTVVPRPGRTIGTGGTGETIDIAPDAPQAPVAAPADGAVRESTGADAPLLGRSSLKNAGRREVKMAAVDAANAAAARLGGWGTDGAGPSKLPNVNRRQRQEWVSRCVRKWCISSKVAIHEGTIKLIGNGGYKFLQDVWDKGVEMTLEDALDAMEVFLRAKGVR